MALAKGEGGRGCVSMGTGHMAIMHTRSHIWGLSAADRPGFDSVRVSLAERFVIFSCD